MIFSLPINFDPTGQASILAAQGKRALGHGNIQDARKFYAESGKLLETDAKSKPKRRDKVLIWFLAATQYFLGGHYLKAQELCRRIERRLLPDRVQEIYRKFWIDVGDRANPEYAQEVRSRISRHRDNGEYRAILEILKDHHYVLDQAKLALFRVLCCERLGDFESAAMFSADVIRKKQATANELLLLLTAWPLSNLANKQLKDAWTYAQHLLKYVPHALTSLTASLIRFSQAIQEVDGIEKRRLHLEQLQHLKDAENRFETIPHAVQCREDWRKLFMLGFGEAALAYRNLGELEAAHAALNRAIDFNPKSSTAWSIRGSFKFPGPGAATDFRKAIELGEKDYSPYAYLAADAINRRDYSEAVEWLKEALMRRPNSQAEAWLRQCLAITTTHLNETTGDADLSDRSGTSVASSNGLFSYEESLRRHLEKSLKALSQVPTLAA